MLKEIADDPKESRNPGKLHQLQSSARSIQKSLLTYAEQRGGLEGSGDLGDIKETWSQLSVVSQGIDSFVNAYESLNFYQNVDQLFETHFGNQDFTNFKEFIDFQEANLQGLASNIARPGTYFDRENFKLEQEQGESFIEFMKRAAYQNNLGKLESLYHPEEMIINHFINGGYSEVKARSLVDMFFSTENKNQEIITLNGFYKILSNALENQEKLLPIKECQLLLESRLREIHEGWVDQVEIFPPLPERAATFEDLDAEFMGVNLNEEEWNGAPHLKIPFFTWESSIITRTE